MGWIKKARERLEERKYYAGRRREMREEKLHEKDQRLLQGLKKRQAQEKTKLQVRRQKRILSETKAKEHGGGVLGALSGMGTSFAGSELKNPFGKSDAASPFGGPVRKSKKTTKRKSTGKGKGVTIKAGGQTITITEEKPKRKRKKRKNTKKKGIKSPIA